MTKTEQLAHPVSTARARMTPLVETLSREILALSTTLFDITDALKVLTDPDAAFAEIDTITRQADARIADSTALAVHAESGGLGAQAHCAEADAVASDALRDNEQLSVALAAAHAALAQAGISLDDSVAQ